MIAHIGIIVRDIERSKKFYTAALIRWATK